MFRANSLSALSLDGDPVQDTRREGRESGGGTQKSATPSPDPHGALFCSDMPRVRMRYGSFARGSLPPPTFPEKEPLTPGSETAAALDSPTALGEALRRH